jgi:hypothetical protein
VLDFQEEALDEVALAIKGVVAGDLRRCCPGWDDRYGILVFNGLPQGLGIVALVTQDIVGGKISDQGFSLSDIARLSRRQDEAERIAQSVDDGMDLSGQPTA